MIPLPMRKTIALAASLFFLSTWAVADESAAMRGLDHDRHPGLSHPEEGDEGHRHGDSDDHHETPDSPCHHHDEHSCCNSGQALGLPSAAQEIERRSNGFVSIPCLEPRVLPSVRELLHVPLA